MRDRKQYFFSCYSQTPNKSWPYGPCFWTRHILCIVRKWLMSMFLIVVLWSVWHDFRSLTLRIFLYLQYFILKSWKKNVLPILYESYAATHVRVIRVWRDGHFHKLHIFPCWEQKEKSMSVNHRIVKLLCDCQFLENATFIYTVL